MAHELELIDGKAQMFSGESITPWHGLGTVIEGLATSEEALKLAGLDWNVDLRQLYQFDGDTALPVPDRFATVRDSDNKTLGIVSADYHVYQNIDAFGFLNELTDTAGEAVFTTAGSLFGGSRTFMVLKLTNGFTVGDQDAHDLYLMCTNSHDGSQAFGVSVTPIRAVCNNTVTMGLAAAKTKWTMRHKVSLEGRVQDAREVLELSFRYESAFQQQVEAMMDIEISKDKMFKIADKIIPASPRQHDLFVEDIMNIWENEPTVKMGGGEGNGWGAFNAVTFFTDHKEYRTPESRFNSILGSGIGTGLGERLRPAAQKMIMAMA
jgi:phage/plasmid-like protein (TIGR03299 family)